MNFYFCSIALLFAISCNVGSTRKNNNSTIIDGSHRDSTDTNSNQHSKRQTDTSWVKKNASPLLLNFSSQLIEWTKEDLEEHRNRRATPLTVFSKTIIEGKIVILLLGVQGIADYKGNIEINNDVIVLYYWIDSVESILKSLASYEFEYQISLPDKTREYKIKLIPLEAGN